MRVGHNTKLALIGAAAFLAVLVVSAPAALLAPLIKNAAAGVSYQVIDGTIWHPRIGGLHAGGVAIGDVKADILGWRLFVGAIAYNTTIKGSAVNGSAVLSQSLFGATEITDANIKVERSLLRRYALMGVPVDGTAEISDARIQMKSRRCTNANGALETDALGAVSNQFGLGEIGLTGTIECADENLTLRLSGQQGDFGDIAIDLAQLAGSRYRLQVIIHTDDPALQQALQLGGFENADGEMIYEEIASWASPPQPAPERRQVKSVADGA